MLQVVGQVRLQLREGLLRRIHILEEVVVLRRDGALLRDDVDLGIELIAWTQKREITVEFS